MNRAAELDALIDELGAVVAEGPEMAGAVTSTAETLVVLAALTDREKAEVLDSLIAQDPALAARAGREGRGVLAAVEIDLVASAVADAVLRLDQEKLSHHAGRTRYGYVEPSAAAWSLLEATLEPWLVDITRRAELGFHGSARQIALGMLQGLDHADDHGASDELLLSWAPDFTDEARETLRRQLVGLGIEPIKWEGDCGSSATGPGPAP